MQSEIKLVCFDLNKTLIKENTWLNLNLDMGMTKEEDDLLFELWEEGVISYNEAQSLIERIYKKRGKATKEAILKSISKYTYVEGAKEIVKYLKYQGYKVALITGSLTVLAEKVAQELDIDFFEANNILIFNEKNYLESLIPLGDDSLVKLRHLESFCNRLNISIDECVCIGDGDNDALMFERCGHGITFKGSKIEKIAWKTITSLAEIKNIL
jgi:phosphoserine phosphatase